eukprot:scaffold442_cov268-Pinguiococcus_pyrenoidosus.AAC.33
MVHVAPRPIQGPSAELRQLPRWQQRGGLGRIAPTTRTLVVYLAKDRRLPNSIVRVFPTGPRVSLRPRPGGRIEQRQPGRALLSLHVILFVLGRDSTQNRLAVVLQQLGYHRVVRILRRRVARCSAGAGAKAADF